MEYLLKSYQEFLQEDKSFDKIYKKKNKWIELKDKSSLKELKDNLYVLVDNSYAALGGHPSIPDPDSVIKLDYWEAIDNDKDDDADSVLFGKERNGVKISGIGHDNSKNGKSSVVAKLAKQLNKKGYWIEASDKLEEVLYAKDVTYITDIEIIKKLFKTDEIEWLNDRGKYRRKVTPIKYSIETVFGNPKLK